jgi:flagellar hook-associated protein FlgK
VEELILSYLDGINCIEIQIASAPKRLLVKKVGDIELNNQELEDLRSERKRMIKELSNLIDIPIVGGSSGMMISVVS